MRPIFCGNFEFDARSGDLERLFRRYGKVDRVDMKSGFAFIYMDDERDAEYAIRALDRTEFGRNGRRLRVEWTKHERNERGDRAGDRGDRGDRGGDRGDRGVRKSASSRRSANLKPSKTLFVINFPYDTQTRDLERHFDPYGKIANVRIRKNFAFVQYESQEDATRALDATNMSKMLDRVISVEYSARDDNDRKGGENSPDRRGRDRSPDRRRRSPSPYKRERGSPDYGTGAAYSRERGSPEYVRGSSRSPRRSLRSSPKYDRPSPAIEKEAAPIYRRDRSRSPREEGASPYRRDRSQSPREEGAIPDYRSQSPHEEGAITDYHRDRSLSPRGAVRNGNGYDRRRSRSPDKRKVASPVIEREDRSPANNEPEMKEDGEYESPVEDRYKRFVFDFDCSGIK